MTIVRVNIAEKDRKIGAMVKALAVEISGYKAVRGTTKEFLSANGYLEFPFKYPFRAAEFRDTLGKYLPGKYATVQMETSAPRESL
jgi:hypothetical protein